MIRSTVAPGSGPGFRAPAGKVSLVGAGPGDPELLTIKAFNALKAADIVFFDDLVAPEILDLLPEGARCIYVGKPAETGFVTQSDIITHLIGAARAGNRVVRLKGGDPMVFGRSGEEIAALRAAGIEADVVPGITAAAGAAASTGITLTHRDYAQQVSFVTAAKRDGAVADVTGLAGKGKTLVVYMGVARAAALKDALLADGVDADWPVAIVENATRPSERVVITTLGALPQTITGELVRSPALFIIGEVVTTYVGAKILAAVEAE